MIGGPGCAGLLRRLAISDEGALRSIGCGDAGGGGLPHLQDKVQALACLAALIATQSPEASYQRVVGFALAAGTTEEEMLGVLLHVAPIVGSARVTSAAPHLASALGYDLDRMFDS